ncbi:MAG: endolytic transglycosylase MltG [bacterium]|nr:endolytic transglycosylase MltG [bacterium]
MKIKQLTFSLIGTIFRIVVVIVLALFIYKAGLKAYDFGYRIFAEEPMSVEPGRDVDVTITQGKSVMDIGKMLQEKGLIKDAQLFYVQEKLSSHKGKIQPGTYTLNTSMSTEDMMKIMAANAPEDGEESDNTEDTSAAENTSEQPIDPATVDMPIDDAPAENAAPAAEEGATE